MRRLVLQQVFHLGSVARAGHAGTACNGTNPAGPGERQSRRVAAPRWGMKGRVPFEAGDALLALPIASTAGTFLLPPFWQFAVEQIEVEAKTQIQCCEATADAKSLHGRPGRVQELLRDEELCWSSSR